MLLGVSREITRRVQVNGLWKLKFGAYLHDPSHKPFGIHDHEQQRDSFPIRFGLSGADLAGFERSADCPTAAAGRLICPDPAQSGLREDWRGSWMEFRHPPDGGPLQAGAFPLTTAQFEVALTRALEDPSLTGAKVRGGGSSPAGSSGPISRPARRTLTLPASWPTPASSVTRSASPTPWPPPSPLAPASLPFCRSRPARCKISSSRPSTCSTRPLERSTDVWPAASLGKLGLRWATRKAPD